MLPQDFLPPDLQTLTCIGYLQSVLKMQILGPHTQGPCCDTPWPGWRICVFIQQPKEF